MAPNTPVAAMRFAAWSCCGVAAPAGSRGPKRRTDLDSVVRAAIELADAEGLDAVSMRRVAERLGIGTMSLYTYVPGKGELLDLMLDTVYGQRSPDVCSVGGHVAGGARGARS